MRSVLLFGVLSVAGCGGGTEPSPAPTRMPTGRSGHAAAVVRGCLYVFGGEGNPAVPSGVFAQNEVYDPGTDSWAGLAPMPSPRHGIGAAVVGDRVFVRGGAAVQGFGASGAHEAFEVPAGRSCS